MHKNYLTLAAHILKWEPLLRCTIHRGPGGPPHASRHSPNAVRTDRPLPRSVNMTLLTPEQFAAAQKANFETLFGLTTKAFEGVEKLVELNLQVVKSTLAES